MDAPAPPVASLLPANAMRISGELCCCQLGQQHVTWCSASSVVPRPGLLQAPAIAATVIVWTTPIPIGQSLYSAPWVCLEYCSLSCPSQGASHQLVHSGAPHVQTGGYPAGGTMLLQPLSAAAPQATQSSARRQPTVSSGARLWSTTAAVPWAANAAYPSPRPVRRQATASTVSSGARLWTMNNGV